MSIVLRIACIFLVLISIGCVSQQGRNDVTDPAITSTSVRYYIDNDIYIGSEICYDVNEKRSKPIADEMSGLTKAKWSAAMYRYYSAVELRDGKYVCRVKNGAEINLAESVYDMLNSNLAEINNWLQKNKVDVDDIIISDEYLNMLLNSEFDSDEHPE